MLDAGDAAVVQNIRHEKQPRHDDGRRGIIELCDGRDDAGHNLFGAENRAKVRKKREKQEIHKRKSSRTSSAASARSMQKTISSAMADRSTVKD